MLDCETLSFMKCIVANLFCDDALYCGVWGWKVTGLKDNNIFDLVHFY